MTFNHLKTAYALLHALRTGPILPFILTPLLTTLPLPKSLPSKPLQWTRIMLVNLALALLREAAKVGISLAVRAWRQQQKVKYEAISGPVSVSGDDLNTADDVECLICSGGSEDIMAQSISSISSLPNEPPALLGPLEAFCTRAPQKHVAHRECFMRWHAAYQQQRVTAIPETVVIQVQGQDSDTSLITDEDKAMAVAILRASGFHSLIPSLHSASEAGLFLPNVMSRMDAVQELLLHTKATGKADPILATLKTRSPPCPGCRSAVALRFKTSPPAPTTTPSIEEDASTLSRALVLADSCRQEWSSLVTGRSIVIRLATQYTFLFALISMIQTRRTTARG